MCSWAWLNSMKTHAKISDYMCWYILFVGDLQLSPHSQRKPRPKRSPLCQYNFNPKFIKHLSSILQSSRIWLVSDRKEINILALSVIFFFFLHENSRLSCSLKWNKTNQTKKNSKGTFKFLDQIQSNYFMWSNL